MAGITPAVAVKRSRKLRMLGDETVKTGDYKGAIELYTKAVSFRDLPDATLSNLLEKRAQCNFSIVEKLNRTANGFEKHYGAAFADATKAVELNPKAWKCHRILGLLYKQKCKYAEAVEHLKMAQTMVTDEQTLQSLGKDAMACRKLELEEAYSHQMLIEDTDCAQFQMKMGFSKNEVFPGSSIVEKGNNSRDGANGVSKNLDDAGNCYKIAAGLGNTVAAYHLAVLSIYGDYGEYQNSDVQKVIELLFEAGKKPALVEFRGYTFTDIGVQATQFILGELYENGRILPKDFKKAGYWYLKSMQNGCGKAAHNLGILYEAGLGVPKDIKMAAMLWRYGVSKKSPLSAGSLLDYYKTNIEPAAARLMIEVASELGMSEIRDAKPMLYEFLNTVEKQRNSCEKAMMNFENLFSLKSKGLTFMERKERLMRMKTENLKLDDDPPAPAPKPTFGGPVDNTLYLKDPIRTRIIKMHRESCLKGQFVEKQERWNKPPGLINQLLDEEDREHLLPITIVEMHPFSDRIYLMRFINLIVIEEPTHLFDMVYRLVAEDINGDVTGVEIANFPIENKDIFGVGSIYAVLNPYMMYSENGLRALRVDDPVSLVNRGKVKDMCQYCGNENASLKCGTCKKTRYCSKNCQKADWKGLGHKMVCSADAKEEE